VKALSKTVFALYLFLLVWLVLFKLNFNLALAFASHIRSVNVIPFANASPSNVRGWILNVVAFIPFGFLLSVNLKRLPVWQRLAIVFMGSLDFELIQFIFAIGITDITDVITNTLGGLLGLLLYALGNRYVDEEKLDRYVVLASCALLLMATLILGVFFFRHVRFRESPHQALAYHTPAIS
jgi:glycopeptide antibiotics resistance protein